MTLDELTVRINVVADEAMGLLDGLIAREQQLRSRFGGSYRVNMDTGRTADMLRELGRLAEETSGSLEGLEFGRGFDQARANIQQLEPDFSQWLRGKYDAMLAELERQGVTVSGEMQDVMWNVLNNAFSLGEFDNFAQLEAVVESTLTRLSEAMKDPALDGAVQTLDRYWTLMSSGMDRLSDAQRTEMSDAWRKLFDDDGVMVEMLSDIPGITENAAQSLMALGLNMVNVEEDAGRFAEGMLEGAQGAEDASERFWETAESADDLGVELRNQRAAMRDLLGEMTELGRNRISVEKLREMRRMLTQCRDGSDEYRDALVNLRRRMNEAGFQAESASEGLEGIDDAIGEAAAGVSDGAESIAGELQSVMNWAAGAQRSVRISGNVNVDTGGAVSALNGLIAVAQQAISTLSTLGVLGASGAVAGGLAGINGISSKKKSGGGGGGGGKSRREQEIEDYYALIEHKKHLDQLTLEEELRMLETLRRRYQLNAEERMEWEEKVYDVKKAIRERDAEQIDRLSDGVMEALERRYETMLDQETKRLEKSRDSWEKWCDDSVAAIRAQIDALDRLAEAEEREDRDAEELRKIEKLRQEMEYEQDSFNREMLRIQLEEAIADREERLRKLAVEDQKEALRKEIELIEQKTDEQLKALDEEEKQIQEYYDERMKAANLQAEAEKLILKSNQKQLMELLYEYVPEYDALGQSMGEKLLNGFMKKAGSIAGWFESFNKGIAELEKDFAKASVLAAQSFYESREAAQRSSGEVVVNQSVTFNEPVESPGQVARRMEDVNDALGRLLA